MSATGTVLQDLLQALRSTGAFALVSLAGAGPSTVVPRAVLAFDGEEVFPSDDGAANRWVRLRARLTVHVRCDDPGKALLRAADLCEQAAEALLADPRRAGHCRDLPVGRATEIGRSEMSFTTQRPEAEMAFAVRCHYEIAE